MRIISGSHKSRRIHPPKSLPVRPTTDIAKESLFNIIGNHLDIEDLDCLDLFTGTGNISYELASRQAGSIDSVDINARCIRYVEQTAKELGFKNIRSIRSNVFVFLKRIKKSYGLIFADPPYDMEQFDEIPQIILERNMLNKGGWLIVEHPEKWDATKLKGFREHRKYGKVNFSIFENPVE